jgi:hypothetical protein
MNDSRDRGEYPKIERYKQEKSKKLDLEKCLVECNRTLFSLRALAFRFPKYKPIVSKYIDVTNDLKAEIAKTKENLVKYGQPSKRATDESHYILEKDPTFRIP